AAIPALGAAQTALAAVAHLGGPLAGLARQLAAQQSELGEAAQALARELESIDGDPAELDALEARLDALERLKRRYGGTLAAVLAERERAAAMLAEEGDDQGRERALARALAEERAALANAASRLRRLRESAARRLESALEEELAQLALPAARFVVAFEPLETAGPGGSERANFLLAPNPGEPPRPLARAASGGELSRVLLALVVALAEVREPTTLTFDEIDAGIGGATALAVGERLGRLARDAQVLCVTHLAQIAVLADRHYALRKHVARAATTIEVVALDDRDARLSEIARMLSGSNAPVALDHAEALVRAAVARKGSRKVRVPVRRILTHDPKQVDEQGADDDSAAGARGASPSPRR
ncbi:MAG: DNA repair protein RecN, partial [Vulcanimicrobiaceae bacterium]